MSSWKSCDANLEEQSLHAADASGNVYHTHGYLMWVDGIGVRCRSLDAFEFEGVRPRIDVCTMQTSTRKPHSSALHGLWYVALRKAGTLHTATNYAAGTWYKPLAYWLQNLYQDHKLSYSEYMRHSATDFPVGHANRKRDADEALRDLRQKSVEQLVKQELDNLRTSGSLKEPRAFGEIDDFVASFKASTWRRPILLIVGATNLGKSMLAASAPKAAKRHDFGPAPGDKQCMEILK